MHHLLTSLDSTRRLVSERLRSAVCEAEQRLAHVGAEAQDLTRESEDLLRGGKRLRAAFAVAGWSACGGPEPSSSGSPVIAAGASLELFQAAALVHDDVMDGSLTRRGRPAAHRHHAALHRDRGWLGSADRFGEASAILLGDLLLVMSFREMSRATAGVESVAAQRAQDVYDLMTAEVTLGQYLDMVAQAVPWADDAAQDRDRAERVVRSKSARYSVEHPIVLGAALAGADDGTLAALSRFGLPIGEAFQLRDDLLGTFGEPSVTGKPAGDDLREGKRTLLVTHALDHATPRDRAALTADLGRADLDDAGIDRLRGILLSTGAVEHVEALIEERTATGFAALAEAGLSERATFELRTLARLAVERTA